MAAISNTKITIYDVRSEFVDDEYLEVEKEHKRDITISAWIKQINSESTLSSLGVFTLNTYKCRFNHVGLNIFIGQKIVDKYDKEYKIIAITSTGGLYNVIMEAI